MKKIDVFINDGTLTTKKYDAKVEIKDKASDLAIIKIIDNNFNGINQIPYSINTGLLKIGEDVFTLGYPLINTMGESIKITSGIISSKVGYNDDLNSYQISVPIQPGNSGGPLFDLEGNIVGVINAMHLNTDNVGYAIKANVLSNILDLVEIKILSNNKINNKKLSYFGEKYSGYVVIIKGYWAVVFYFGGSDN